MKKLLGNLFIIGLIYLYIAKPEIGFEINENAVRVIHLIMVIYLILIFVNDGTRFLSKKIDERFSNTLIKARRKIRTIRKKLKL